MTTYAITGCTRQVDEHYINERILHNQTKQDCQQPVHIPHTPHSKEMLYYLGDESNSARNTAIVLTNNHLTHARIKCSEGLNVLSEQSPKYNY